MRRAAWLLIVPLAILAGVFAVLAVLLLIAMAMACAAIHPLRTFAQEQRKSDAPGNVMTPNGATRFSPDEGSAVAGLAVLPERAALDHARSVFRAAQRRHGIAAAGRES